MRCLALAAALLVAVPVTTHAQPLGWSFVDGEPAYTADYTTEGIFSCGTQRFLPGTSCAATGTTLTLGNGGNFVTFAFVGTTQRLTATAEATPVTLATITKSFSGTGPFTFPVTSRRPGWAFGLEVRIGRDETQVRYRRLDGGTTAVSNCCEGNRDYLSRPVPPFDRFRYTHVVFSGFDQLVLTTAPAPDELTVRVGLVPEPGTWALLGTGLLAVGGVARRRQPA